MGFWISGRLRRLVVAVVVVPRLLLLRRRDLVVRAMRWIDDRALAEHAGVSTMVGIAMVCAIITQAIGIHAVFGAFIAGVMLGRSARLRRSDRDELQALTIGVFAPVFFAYSGLKVDLFALHGVGLLGLVLGIAIAGKLVGCGLGGIARRAQTARVAGGRDRDERARRDGNHRRADRTQSRRADPGDVRDHRDGRDCNLADDAAIS